MLVGEKRNPLPMGNIFQNCRTSLRMPVMNAHAEREHGNVNKNSLSQNTVDNPLKEKSHRGTLYADQEKLLQHMRFELNRLKSFEEKWPLSYVKPQDLAETGFFYLQIADEVQCAFCQGVVADWLIGDRPLKEHVKNFPLCPFLIGENVGNVPIGRDYLQISVRPERYQTSKFEVYRPEFHILSSIPGRAEKPQTSKIDDYKPKYPAMSNSATRFSTFKSWPKTVQLAENLAQNGFYYTGREQSDEVTCFFCGGCLGNWNEYDDPWEEHCKYFSSCGYIELRKSHGASGSSSTATSSSACASSNNTRYFHTKQHLSKEEIISKALEIFPEALVTQAVKEHTQEAGVDIDSVHTLCDRILKIKERLSNTEQVSADNEASLPVQSDPPKEAFLCKICMDKEMEVVFQPCGHFVSCQRCSNVISKCPLCRKPIMNTVRTYLS